MAKRAQPKPSPLQVAVAAFFRVCGIASAPWEKIPGSMAAALKENSYLKSKNLQGLQDAEETIRRELAASGLIPLGGDIDGSRATDVSLLALRALERAERLTDKARTRLAGDL